MINNGKGTFQIFKTRGCLVNKLVRLYGFMQKDKTTSTIPVAAMNSDLKQKFSLPERFSGNERSVW